jgi:hypoxanthine phosphoribosyltransferase
MPALSEARPFRTAEQIAARVAVLAIEIDADMPEGFVLVGVLNGAVPFVADLARRLTRVGPIEWCGVESYQGMMAGRMAAWTLQIRPEQVAERDVLLVDDIGETGRTLELVERALVDAGAASVSTCTLLYKRNCGGPRPRWVGFECGRDEFLVGYGLDLDGRLRGLSYLASFTREGSEPG